MHIYFVGIGGTGIGPLAIIANQSGYRVSGSDKQASKYFDYVQKQGLLDAAIAKDESHLAKIHATAKVDWVVTTSAAEKEQADHPILAWARQNGIKVTKRDEFLSWLISEKSLKLIAIAGTHGKTTTTAMMVWLFKQLGQPISYSVGAKLSFGEMGEYNPQSQYFVYECDEYDRNFLSFQPHLSLISGIAYDHPDIYPTEQKYFEAFRQFVAQSATTICWEIDAAKAQVPFNSDIIRMNEQPLGLASLTMAGEVNRRNARLVMQAAAELFPEEDLVKLAEIMNQFPGVSRRFEKISENIYSDYAHTPEKIAGALQMAKEMAGENFVVVYEGLHNTRQHFIKAELKELFSGAKKLYIVPSYRAREDESLEDLTPTKLCELVKQPTDKQPAELNDELKSEIAEHVAAGDLVLCLSAGGGGSLDEWLRKNF